ncbi:uncharacterized protein EI90DRAFT_3156324 [Cantharellus anzutake]|uniref:uncharacterized protein n=1 Tax=Cantharellus anzutake TaxID=1750568 RepID=UPI00190408A2|nr:uncharacterized protein EI90DRAFT_3156324 [Cantharellus anzutake]KAF8327274.1 hypothetical protein EI90DRAFT_3156324 [Cantharellus anzutake]
MIPMKASSSYVPCLHSMRHTNIEQQRSGGPTLSSHVPGSYAHGTDVKRTADSGLTASRNLTSAHRWKNATKSHGSDNEPNKGNEQQWQERKGQEKDRDGNEDGHLESEDQAERDDEEADVDIEEDESPISDPPSELESEDSISPPPISTPAKSTKSKFTPKPKVAAPPKQKPPSTTSKPVEKPPVLKVTLKWGKSRLGGAGGATSSSKVAPSTTSDSLQEGATPDRDPVPKKKRTRLVGESEDDDFDELDMDEQSLNSTSRLTVRQAALASGTAAAASLLELPTKQSSKKKNLNAEELAARRAETAKKRKELTTQKLEDDKTETINRLLKRQSAGTRRKKAIEELQSNTGNRGSLQPESTIAPIPTPRLGSEDLRITRSVPCFRWISTSRPPALASSPTTKKMEESVGCAASMERSDEDTTMKAPEEGSNVRFSFSIPFELLPSQPPAGDVT